LSGRVPLEGAGDAKEARTEHKRRNKQIAATSSGKMSSFSNDIGRVFSATNKFRRRAMNRDGRNR
jgi:hypothetical protein